MENKTTESPEITAARERVDAANQLIDRAKDALCEAVAAALERAGYWNPSVRFFGGPGYSDNDYPGDTVKLTVDSGEITIEQDEDDMPEFIPADIDTLTVRHSYTDDDGVRRWICPESARVICCMADHPGEIEAVRRAFDAYIAEAAPLFRERGEAEELIPYEGDDY